MWVIVIRDGQNKAAVAEGRRKVESLRKFLTK
jgi:hypothetical protein